MKTVNNSWAAHYYREGKEPRKIKTKDRGPWRFWVCVRVPVESDDENGRACEPRFEVLFKTNDEAEAERLRAG